MNNSLMTILISMTASFVLLIGTAFADSKHHGSTHKENANMHMKSDHSEGMMRAELGPARIKEFTSQSGQVKAFVPMLPKTPGWAEFNVHLKTSNDSPLGKDARVEASFEMPGMPMDTPAVVVKRISDEEWQMGLPLEMAGLWKVHLSMQDAGMKDQLQIKMVTKNPK